MKTFNLLLYAFILFFTVSFFAQEGELDSGFGTNGIVTQKVGILTEEAYAVSIQSDGKIITAGYCVNSSSNYDIALARFNSDGSLDDSFDGDSGTGDGIVTIDFGSTDEMSDALAIQPDGKIVVAGSTGEESAYVFAIVRFNSNGTLDTGFGTGGKVTTAVGGTDDCANSIAIQSDGKIVVAGYTYTGSAYEIAVVRYTNDGSLDTDFGNGGIVTTAVGSTDDNASSIGIQSDGKIVVAGYTDTGSMVYDFAVVRYNSDGSLDTSFGSNGIVTTNTGSVEEIPYSLSIDANNKIVISGYSIINDVSMITILRYNSDGSLDNSFDTDGIVIVNLGYDAVSYSSSIQLDKKIVLAGSAIVNYYMCYALVRLNENGSLDTDFSGDGTVITVINNNSDDFANSVAIQTNGDIVAAGCASDGLLFSLTRYTGSSGPLPVELTLFTAAQTDEGILLSWQTATEVNNYGFDIELRIENGEWEKRGFVEGNGNSNSPKSYEYLDNHDLGLDHDLNLKYRLKQIDTDGSFTYYNTTASVNAITGVNELSLPEEFSLSQNYPNPFNPTTTIKYALPEINNVQITINNLLGQTIATLIDEIQAPGNYEVKFDGTELASGVYVYKLTSGDFISVKKLMLLK